MNEEEPEQLTNENDEIDFNKIDQELENLGLSLEDFEDIDQLIDVILSSLGSKSKKGIMNLIGRYFDRMSEKKNYHKEEKKALENKRYELMKRLKSLVVFIDGKIVENKNQKNDRNSSKENFREIVKRSIIYEIYKALNPRKIAGETSLENFINNTIIRGIRDGLKYSGKKNLDEAYQSFGGSKFVNNLLTQAKKSKNMMR